MSLLQAQLLLNMSSLEPVNFGVQQNNSEAFAVALCHLAELHAEQVRPPQPPLHSCTSPTAVHPGQVTVVRPVFFYSLYCRAFMVLPLRSCST